MSVVIFGWKCIIDKRYFVIRCASLLRTSLFWKWLSEEKSWNDWKLANISRIKLLFYIYFIEKHDVLYILVYIHLTSINKLYLWTNIHQILKHSNAKCYNNIIYIRIHQAQNLAQSHSNLPSFSKPHLMIHSAERKTATHPRNTNEFQAQDTAKMTSA